MIMHMLLLAVSLSFGQDAMKGVDDLMRQAEVSVLLMEKLGTKQNPECPPGVTVRNAVQDFAEGKLGQDASLMLTDRGPLLQYYACRALAAGSSAPCTELRSVKLTVDFGKKGDKKDLQRPETYEFLCVSGYTDLAVAKAGISGNKKALIAACKEHDEAGHRDFKPGKLDEACSLLADNFGKPDNCRRIAPLFRSPVAVKYCENEMKLFTGDPSACVSLTEPDEKRFCEAAAAYKKAFTGKNIAHCGTSGICRAMMGDAKVCDDMGRHAARRICGQQYNQKFAASEHSKATMVLGEVSKLLESLDAGELGPKGALLVDDRLNRLARLRFRAEQARKRFPTPENP